MKKLNVLILGADGFIGSNLARSLAHDGKYQVRAFDIFKDGKSKNLTDVKDKIEIFPGDFLCKENIEKALRGIDYVFHYISFTTPGSSITDPLTDIEKNIKGSVILFEECVKKNVKKIIFPSSGGAIYGNQNKSTFSETDATDPISPYAISKLTIEKYLAYYKNHYGLDYLILRYANPYGPGQNITGGQGIVSIFLHLIKDNKPITVFGDGKNVRDYVYIDDLVHITKDIFNRETKYSVYNVGGGEGVDIRGIISTIEKVTGRIAKIEYKPSRDIDVKNVLLNIERVSVEIGYFPKISLEEGIRKTWKRIINTEL